MKKFNTFFCSIFIVLQFLFLFIYFSVSLAEESQKTVDLAYEYCRIVDVAPASGPIPANLLSYKGYLYESIRIQSSAELLRAMRAGSEEDLSDEQKGLFKAFNHGSSDNMKKRLSYASECNIPDNSISVYLLDTTFIQGVERSKLRNDLWPMAIGNKIILSCIDRSPTDTASLLAHETSHTVDNINLNLIDYGKDKRHHLNEVSTKSTAFSEGWAIFNQYYDFPSTAMLPSKLMYETASSAFGHPDYVMRSLTDSEVAPEDFLKTEGVVSEILFHIAHQIPDGFDKIFKSFLKIRNDNSKDITSLINVLLDSYPEDSKKIMEIFARDTASRFSSEEFKKSFPNHFKDIHKKKSLIKIKHSLFRRGS
ncbi:MAG: hypothetical protein HQM10_18915 [Candidatus Riflebacteria bacterium]|nr:hypothetical protein [Candidatus Riflebacteria bacterium]